MNARRFRRTYSEPIPVEYIFPRPATEPLVIDVNYRAPHRRHHHHRRDDNYVLPHWAVPGTTCAFRCGHPRMYGSTCCKYDTCKTDNCFKPSTIREGYCAEHGCRAEGCSHSRQMTKMECTGDSSCRCGRSRHGRICLSSVNYHLSAFCKRHMCPTWGCDHQGRKDLGGYCYGHFEIRYICG